MTTLRTMHKRRARRERLAFEAQLIRAFIARCEKQLQAEAADRRRRMIADVIEDARRDLRTIGEWR